MATVRSLIQCGDLPTVVHPDDQERKHTEFERALGHGGTENHFRKVYNLFSREQASTDMDKGIHMMYGLVGDAYTGARATVYAVALQNEAAVLDMTKITPRALASLKIQEIVDYITTILNLISTPYST